MVRKKNGILEMILFKY